MRRNAARVTDAAHARSPGARYGRALAATLASSALVALTGCSAPEVSLGGEHRRTVAALGVTPATGELFEAGFEGAATRDDAAATAWYGWADRTGTLRDVVELTGLPGAVARVVRVSDGWVLAGFTTADGVRVGWARRVSDSGAEAWTRTFPGPASHATETLALTPTPDDGVVLGGLDTAADGTVEGWLARLGAGGATAWQSWLATDFQGQTKGARPRAVAVVGSSVQQVFVAGDRTQAGAVFPMRLQLTLDGQLWDSGHLDPAVGAATDVFADEWPAYTYCLQLGDAVAVQRWSGLSTLERTLPFAVDGARLELGGCAADATTLVVAATVVAGDGQRTPWLAKVTRAGFSAGAPRTVDAGSSASALGVALGTGGGVLFGRSEALLRRWVVPLP